MFYGFIITKFASTTSANSRGFVECPALDDSFFFDSTFRSGIVPFLTPHDSRACALQITKYFSGKSRKQSPAGGVLFSEGWRGGGRTNLKGWRVEKNGRGWNKRVKSRGGHGIKTEIKDKGNEINAWNRRGRGWAKMAVFAVQLHGCQVF